MADMSGELYGLGMFPQMPTEKEHRERSLIPIGSFKRMREYGIVYQFMSLRIWKAFTLCRRSAMIRWCGLCMGGGRMGLRIGWNWEEALWALSNGKVG